MYDKRKILIDIHICLRYIKYKDISYRSTAIVNLLFENFGISSVKVEIVSFQMVIILQKLTTLKGFYGKTNIGCLNS